MHTLRHASHLTRLLLAVWVLVLWVGVVAPVFNPQILGDICSVGEGQGTGVNTVGQADAGNSAPMADHGVHCPLCLAPAALAAVPAAWTPPHGLAHEAARWAWVLAPPVAVAALPAVRGPPHLS